MIEQAFIETLAADVELTGLLSSYAGAPAVFSDVAPQDAVTPYIVFNIDLSSVENIAITSFTIDIDIYDGGVNNLSRLTSDTVRKVTERIEFVTDRIDIPDPNGRYESIRFFRGSQGYIRDRNTHIKHYNMIITARAARKKWMDNL